MAWRSSAAAHEGFLLLCVGSQHGAGRASDDRCVVLQGTDHDSGHRGGCIFSAGQHFAFEHRIGEFRGSAYSCHGDCREHLHFSFAWRCAVPDDDGVCRRSPLAAGRFHPPRNRDGRLFCHTVLWDAFRTRGANYERAASRRSPIGMSYFHWIAGSVLALAWFSRIVGAAIGMPKVTDVALPEWDKNPVTPQGNPRVSIIVPACNEEETIEQGLTQL